MSEYERFLESKAQFGANRGFSAPDLPEFLFDFQRALVSWALEKGRSAILADCGLGKTPMQLVWARECARKTGKPALILTPLAVAQQVVREAEKFAIDCKRSSGELIPSAEIFVTNYERLHHFKPGDFGAVVADESSILKNFDGIRKAAITEFMRTVPYRLLCTATAAPNDYIELGTSSEALGEMGYVDMLGRFFKNDQNTIRPAAYFNRGSNFAEARERVRWRFKGHAEEPFWRWVCSWARACRKPSDLGFSDGRFSLPPLIENEHVVEASTLAPGMMFAMPANGLKEEREERRRTIRERCEMAAELVSGDESAMVWCHLNDEGDLLEELIPGSVQVSGSDSDDDKEAKLSDFAEGNARVLVIKPKIGAWGLNLQNCAHIVTFASHSYEQYYQSVRRCWRFGQTRPVIVDLIATEGEAGVIASMKRKSKQAERMFSRLVEHMSDALRINGGVVFDKKEEIPTWL